MSDFAGDRLSVRFGARLAVAVTALFVSGCGVVGSVSPPARIWALNESSSDYVVRTTTGEAAEVVDTWSFPAGSRGLVVVGGKALWMHVLDARTCAVVDAEPLTGANAINVDVRGHVSFSDARVPDVTTELGRTSQCAPVVTPPPSGQTS